MTEFNPGGADGLNQAVKLRYEANPDTNAFTDAEKTKLGGIEAGANSYVHPDHTGDVTSVGHGVTTILAGAVTNAKLAQVPTATLKGRASAGTGTAEDLAAAQVRAILNVADGATANAADAALRDRGTHTGTQPQSSIANLVTDLAAKASLNVPQSFARAQVVAPAALTDAATITTDASLSNTFTVTLGGNRTLANPTNLVAGSFYTWRVRQDATGGRTLAFGSAFVFPSGVPTLSTAANKRDLITAYCESQTELLCIFNGGF